MIYLPENGMLGDKSRAFKFAVLSHSQGISVQTPVAKLLRGEAWKIRQPSGSCLSHSNQIRCLPGQPNHNSVPTLR